MRKLLLAFAALVALASPALADFTGKDASAATITFKNATGACSSVVCVPQSAITDSTGANFVAVLTVGADGASNTANGLLGYSRNLVFNGTTWDRWTGAVTVASPTLANGSLVKGITAAMTGTTSTQVIAAVTSQHIYVMAVHCNNTGAAATLVNLQDGSGGTTLDTLICGAGSGDERNGGGVPLFWTTAGNALFAADVTTGQSVIVQASGYSSAN